MNTRHCEPARPEQALPGPSGPDSSEAGGLAVACVSPAASAIWLSVADAADLLDSYPVAIRRRLDEFTWRAVPGRGGANGKSYEIALSSLPEDAQRRFYVRREQASSPRLTTVETDPTLSDLDVRANVPEWAREKADHKLAVIRDFGLFYDDARARSSIGKVAAIHLFCEARSDLSERSLTRWLKEYERDGYAGLVDSYGNRAGDLLLTDEDRAEIRATLRSRGDKATAWDRVYKLAKSQGRQMPSYTTVCAYARSPECQLVIDYHEGRETFWKKWEPHRRLDYEDLRPMDVAIGDHHRFDAWCTIEEQIGPRVRRQKIIRPWLTLYYDAKARLDLGHVVCVKPNTETINEAFYQMCTERGIPRRVKHDGGMDFTSKHYIAGKHHRKFPRSQDAEVKGVLALLDIPFTATLPRRGESKNIERGFQEVVRRFAKKWPTYCGKGPEHVPERCRRILAEAQKQIDETGRTSLLPTFEEFRYAFDQWLVNDWRVTPMDKAHGAHGRSPLQIWEEEINARPVKTIPAERLRFLLMNRTKVTIRRDGLEFLGALYFSDDLPLAGTQVIVAYDPEDVSKLFVSSLRGDALCVASRDPRASQLPGGEAQHKELARRRRRIRQKAIALDGEREAYTEQVLAAHEQLVPNPDSPPTAAAATPSMPQTVSAPFGHPSIATAADFDRMERKLVANAPALPPVESPAESRAALFRSITAQPTPDDEEPLRWSDYYRKPKEEGDPNANE